MNVKQRQTSESSEYGKDVAQLQRRVALHPSLRGVRAVIFDAGGTLVHPDWQRLSCLAAEATGRSFQAEEMRRAMNEVVRAVDVILKSGGEAPAYTHHVGWVFRRMYHELGIDDTTCDSLSERMHAAHHERHLWCGLDPEATYVLSELKHAGLRTAVISNTEDGRLEELLGLVEIATHFEFLIDSKIVGHRKPDAAIFHLALSQLGLEPHEAAYVGDSYGHDALGALAVGMHAVLIDPLDLHPESVCPRIRSLRELIKQESEVRSQKSE